MHFPCRHHRTPWLYFISDGLTMDPAKVQTIRDWPELRRVKDIQSFLDFANSINDSFTITPTSLLQQIAAMHSNQLNPFSVHSGINLLELRYSDKWLKLMCPTMTSQ